MTTNDEYDNGYPDDEDFERDEYFYCDCNTPGCCMPGPHFRSECHTAEDIEAYNEECRKADEEYQRKQQERQ